MNQYHKIQTIFKRDPATKNKALLIGEWSLPEFAYLQNNEWEFTEKVDGTNIRVIIEPSSVGSRRDVIFGGKTDAATIPATLFKRLNDRFTPLKDELFKMFPDGGCLYGEGYGARIQKIGENYRKDQDFVLFDVKVGDWWLERHNIEGVGKILQLDVVPIIGHGTLLDMIERVRTGFNSTWGDFQAEGIVARPTLELKTRNGHRIIAKLKHRDFAPFEKKASNLVDA